VRGAHTAFAPPERATVKLVVALEAGDSNSVYSSTVEVANGLRRSIEALHNPSNGPVTWWSSDQVQTWASRPWNKDGKQLPLRFHARVSFQAKFSDFSEMSRWVTGAVEQPGASIGGIEWALTAAHRDALTAKVRAAAVTNALDKAQAYADAIGAGKVRMLAVADAGMLGEGLHPTSGQPASFQRMASAGGGPGGDVEFAPQDISVSAEVDARFITV
ncbi:MAG TPA: SIMPL domain-containing protein, partial [Ilumatobacter sp.]|nr:SIMPL domain-containing protein [Ilumatobacter sp.]